MKQLVRDLQERRYLSELFSKKSARPLKWGRLFGAPEAAFVTSNGNKYTIDFVNTVESFIGRGILDRMGIDSTNVNELIEVLFTGEGGEVKNTRKFEQMEVLATVQEAAYIYITKHRPEYLYFSAKAGSKRISVYRKMLNRLRSQVTALGYKSRTFEYDDGLEQGTDTVIVLMRV